jgi:methylmalonyl-CoA/ethylmalonyl-CoA epimerase
LSIVKFDHIALIVDDLDASLAHFRKIFDVRDADLIYERDYEDVDRDTGNVDVMHFALFPVGEVYFELVEPVSPEGPMMKFLKRTGGGIHHIGLTSNDIRGEWRRHAQEREELGTLGERPRVDQYNVTYWFLHPKKNYGALFEIDSAWAKTSASDMTPIEPTPDWSIEDLGDGSPAGGRP